MLECESDPTRLKAAALISRHDPAGGAGDVRAGSRPGLCSRRAQTKPGFRQVPAAGLADLVRQRPMHRDRLSGEWLLEEPGADPRPVSDSELIGSMIAVTGCTSWRRAILRKRTTHPRRSRWLKSSWSSFPRPTKRVRPSRCARPRRRQFRRPRLPVSSGAPGSSSLARCTGGHRRRSMRWAQH